MSQINACSQIKCPFCEAQPAVGRCTRYSQPTQCHLTTMFEFESDGSWLFVTNQTVLTQMQKVNDRFLSKDKESRKQLEQLRRKKPTLITDRNQIKELVPET
ncbi:MAG TPA: hypothetical protein DEA78_01770 [Cyanobacteria bacterium UBA11159]|nr:hypothetical protein [Cyanobacteria bacterium UBA11367]HBE60735.1 hypothetical protein [Cyanobacteria bacterium UBA11366]HBK65466.1 hypothetical protein [Cyanobacteria bacterium UBA11166]HBR72463.1 hypothetical protein [Cyanobacteria bacterium UBA11159]HBS68266.1 hypothetical protein [Cyanobacteria bacterium UBA11153]